MSALTKYIVPVLAFLLFAGALVFAGVMWSHNGQLRAQVEAVEESQAQYAKGYNELQKQVNIAHNSVLQVAQSNQELKEQNEEIRKVLESVVPDVCLLGVRGFGCPDPGVPDGAGGSPR